MILYFAYGSNMDWGEMRKKCPSAMFFGIAKLIDHEFVIPRKSRTRDCGVAGFRPALGKDVWGVVYAVPETELGVLDHKEGYRPGRPKNDNSYVRIEHHVLLDGDGKKPCLIQTYEAIEESSPPQPNNEYMNLIIGGARFWHLPEDYIRSLESIEVDS